jgi:Spy/CpxP family protein refolding chaperone
MKKKMLLVLPALAIVFAASSAGASASVGGQDGGWHRHHQFPKKHDILVESRNDAYVDNYVSADSNTGHNEAHGNNDPFIETGDASADNWVETRANDSAAEVEADGKSTGEIRVTNRNDASVWNTALAKANTGFNQANHNGTDVAIKTGKAASSNTVLNVVNSTTTKVAKK